MGYRLGIDLGTTYTSAAVLSGNWPSVVGLGNRAMQIPSVVFIGPDGDYLVGEAAEQRGKDEPDRLAREFKRRIGDEVPMLVAGVPQSPQSLTAKLLASVVEIVTQRQGEAPEHIVLTHPANWGPFKRDLFDQAIRMADLERVDTCTEPEAVAVLYASRNVLHPGDTILVYDLGGGTFDAAVLRKTEQGFDLLGSPEGIEMLGGMDFDEAVFKHVLNSLGDRFTKLVESPELTRGLARLKRDCVDAKEALSNDTQAVVPVDLPGLNTRVRLQRSEFESKIRLMVDDTVAAVRRALRSAHLQPENLTAIVLSGGSSRVPLVSHLLTEAFALPLALDTHPKHDVAQGATLWKTQLNGQGAPGTLGHVASEPEPPSPHEEVEQPTGPSPIEARSWPRRQSRPEVAPRVPRHRPSVDVPGGVSRVTGVFCRNQHFNDPRMWACVVCGADLPQAKRAVANDDRPVLGSLVLDDGTSYPLSNDYLLGRDPEADGLVRSGQYLPLRLNDDQNMVSRSHARVELRNWDVVLVDNVSTNGTYFADTASARWHRLPRSGAQLLAPNTRIRVGRRTLSYFANRA